MMRYEVLRPSTPFDPRHATLQSLADMHIDLPVMAECDLESEAVTSVREVFPDAVVMPVPIKVGSGEIYLLGVLENIHKPRDPGGNIPFVMFVQALADNEADRKLIRKRQMFHRHLWKTPVIKPAVHPRVATAELRATDLESPSQVDVTIGRKDDRLVVHVELNGVAISLHFTDRDLFFGSLDPDGKTLNVYGLVERAKEMAAEIERAKASEPPVTVPADDDPRRDAATGRG